MERYILGQKVGMTQIFNENGALIAVTAIKAGPCFVIQQKTEEKDGYNAIKVGFLDQKEQRVNRPDSGQFKKVNVPVKKYIREFRVSDPTKYQVGQEIKVSDMFKLGDKVDVTGISKGKGFQGSIKRWGQGRGPMSHGSHYHRKPGSMGASSNPSRVFKGKKLPGRMGREKTTIQNLDVVRIDSENNLMLIKGSVPGPKGGLLIIKNTVKTDK